MSLRWIRFFFFFFNDTATTEIYTLSLHDALPIWTATAGTPLPERINNSMSLGSGLVLRSEEHTSELQSPCNLVCRLLLEKKKGHIQRRHRVTAPPSTSVHPEHLHSRSNDLHTLSV